MRKAMNTLPKTELWKGGDNGCDFAGDQAQCTLSPSFPQPHHPPADATTSAAKKSAALRSRQGPGERDAPRRDHPEAERHSARDATGKPLGEDVLGAGPPASNAIPHHAVPTQAQPDGLVRIVAALVNDTASPEHETVTLLNTSDRAIDLDGWALADKMKRRMPLSGEIARGGTLVIDVTAPVELSNQGGIITLLNERGMKVHGVSYTRDQARTLGLTVPF